MREIPMGLLEAAVERLKAEFHPESIFLFGSHAWGTPTADSDIDLLVLVPESTERLAQRMQRALRCLGDLDFCKDVFVQTRSEFDRYKHLPASLQHQVVTRGRQLYDVQGVTSPTDPGTEYDQTSRV